MNNTIKNESTFIECECVLAYVLQVYERAVANVPPGLEKRLWQRYIYLWINYAVWEELEAQDPARAREVYRTALKLIPHNLFTFAKVGLMDVGVP